MYEAFHRDRPLIPPGQFCEVRYEDLTTDTIGQMRKRSTIDFYWGWTDSTGSCRGWSNTWPRQAGYKTNRYPMSPETQAEITRHWGWFAEQYGYAEEPAARKPPADSPPAREPAVRRADVSALGSDRD